MISNRFPRANNPYMHEAYDPSKLTKYITYPDANNLYGWAMGQPLPLLTPSLKFFQWQLSLSHWLDCNNNNNNNNLPIYIARIYMC